MPSSSALLVPASVRADWGVNSKSLMIYILQVSFQALPLNFFLQERLNGLLDTVMLV